ncbi:hypothetical protein [uncultured Campylobacter sp.]|uniref:hypothetical protein n=1 Tax=uncultured Campylobacter sp. TaxID=218934 RepID=UPI002627E0DB|nr:hypothetical protein [uncultured Campylobacter sp.]
MRNFKYSRNFRSSWNFKTLRNFKYREISNARKISGPCVRVFKGGAVSQDIRRMPKLRVNFKNLQGEVKFRTRGYPP